MTNTKARIVNVPRKMYIYSNYFLMFLFSRCYNMDDDTMSDDMCLSMTRM